MSDLQQLPVGLPGWRTQAGILADRYLDVLLGDLRTVLLLIAQAPVIAALCVVVWGDLERDTPSLHFMLTLTSVWFGCINAAREIVKERALFERERLIGLSPLAYVVSKIRVLMILDLLQVALLLGIVEHYIGLRGNLAWQAASMLLSVLAGTGLGLLISALARRQERAVAAVPLCILPQLLFSEVAIPRDRFGTVTQVVESLMPARWGYRVFVEAAAAEPSLLWILASLAIQALMTMVLLGAATLALRVGRAEDYL